MTVCTIDDSDTAVLDDVALAPKRLKPPPKYAVVLLNDDYTPMDFVVAVLRQIFNKSDDEATAIMLAVHNDGQGVCGIYTQDIAETRVAQVQVADKEREHPLQCMAREVD